MIFAINAPTLTSLDGSPVTGFVLWQSLTFPQNTVAQDVIVDTANTIAVNLKIFFLL